jgi:branched-chain amino acid transport system substrate-binding protein
MGAPPDLLPILGVKMHSKNTALRRPKTGWATTALFACVALALAAGCGSRLSDDEIAAGTVGSSNSAQSGSGGGSTGASSDAATTGTGAVDVSGSTSSTSGSTTGEPLTGGAATGGTTVGGSTGGSTGATATTSGGGGSAGGGATAGGGSTTGGAGAGTGGPVAVGAPPILGGSAPCVKATKSPIQFGNVSTVSGVLGELFSPVRPALNLFVKSQNECGGLSGHVIKLSIDDDQGDPSTAVTAVNRQINNLKVMAFVGNIQVLTVDAITPIINSKKIPVIGPDITNNTWFTNPYYFPQGSPSQAVSYAYLDMAKTLAKKSKVGSFYCLEVPVACRGIDLAFGELAPKMGVQNLIQKQISITAPSYTSQCLEAQKKGIEFLALTFDAASQGRFANSCSGLNPPYKPVYAAYPLGVGNEDQFFNAGSNLGGTYVPLTTFGWMQNDTPATKYWRDSIKRYGFSGSNGNAASLGWTAGALLVAASAKLSDDPTREELFEGLYSIKNSNLGGLSASRLSFNKVSAGGPAGTVPYCYFVVQSNPNNSAWLKPSTTSKCTALRAPSDPNQ